MHEYFTVCILKKWDFLEQTDSKEEKNLAYIMRIERNVYNGPYLVCCLMCIMILLKATLELCFLFRFVFDYFQ